MHFTLSIPVSLGSILILSSHVCTDFLIVLYLQAFIPDFFIHLSSAPFMQAGRVRILDFMVANIPLL
jgi:hypothetical protein